MLTTIAQLISLINNSSYIVSNDTGPAHICAHLNKRGVVLFGSHTTPEKVSMQSQNFKSLRAETKIINLGDKGKTATGKDAGAIDVEPSAKPI